MLLKAVLIFTAALGAACAQSTPDNTVKATSDGESTPVSKGVKSDLTENECKICDFDFDSYKGELKKEEVDGLLLALNDEYLATAIYKGVNEKFDDPRPFANIVRAEERHATMLKDLFETYKIPVPDNPWLENAPAFDSVMAACEAGVEAEIVNKELYDKVLKSTPRDDILFVYKNLQRASEENHKPAFERCASGVGPEGGSGSGRGRGANR
ncbi:MAG: DUF2202 domain-containing protein [Acidobacteriota bacterium]|nr:DUF2202 domain-containing protein [Acidobacteriota bacterium]MDH3530067.1 DUF2202 domain-containing protein [Acidobacteriota bacterium]